ncbi:MAG: AMP-dependent synthetase and ligase [Frankiales bacterium]|jgi:acyl-CoA synthetase (AMP-forming)/AMP-acid ligase II|nr:AMP-dependent synthetase and ligase [Frankiales bacterium]
MKVPFTTADFLDRAELAYGARVGVVDEPGDYQDGGLGSLTYRDFAARTRALAAGLDRLGVGVGERVAMVSHNSARMLEAFYGVCSSGRVFVPVNFRLSPAEVGYIVEHSGASVLLVDPEVAESLSDIGAKHRFVLGGESDAMYRFDVEPEPWEPDEDATATINYTSGTTARPKGVQVTHRNLWVNAVTFALHAGVSDRDVYLHTLPMFHANGWGMPFGMTGMGVPHVVLRKVDGAEILRRVERYGVTVMCAAPAVVASVLEAAASWEGEIPGRDSVRVICAGAPPPSRTIQRIEEELGWEFLQIYGLTETSPLLTINRRRAEEDALPLEEASRRLSRAGTPAIGVKIKISDQGEVLARSNVVLEGYWEQPDATADALEGGWFHTGDGGTVDDEGYVTISDRRKDVIITGGENVSSIEVEDCLFSHDAVAEVAVIGVPSEKWGETIKALVVLAPGASATEEQLIKHCKARLAGYKAPTSVEFRTEIPRTATGKVQKFKLREQYWQGYDRQVN